MAWIGVDLDDTVLRRDGTPEEGAIAAMQRLLEDGHRVTIWTARFSRATEEEKEPMRLQVAQQLRAAGIPYTDIWMGPKPCCDIFIGDNLVHYDGNWPVTLNQAYLLLQERGRPSRVTHEFEDEP